MSLDLFAETVLANFARRKVRLALTSLGVVVGTSAVVLMVGLGVGLQVNAEMTFNKPGAATRVQVYSTVDKGEPGRSPEAVVLGREPRVLDDDAAKEIGSLPAVRKVTPSLQVPTDDVSFKRHSAPVSVIAVDDRAVADLGGSLASGRWPARAKEVVVGSAVPGAFLESTDRQRPGAQSLGTVDLLGETLTFKSKLGSPEGSESAIRSSRVRVVGILEPADENVDRSIYVPLAVAQRLADPANGSRRQYSEAVVQARSPEDVAMVTRDVMELGFIAFSQREVVDQSGRVFRLLQLGLGGIASIALFVACIGIANTMTMATYERTREIGIMKAVGASSQQIRRMFLAEAAIIGAGSGLIGLLFSMALAALVNFYVRHNSQLPAGMLFQIPAWLSLSAVLFATTVGVAAGMVPASRAARLNPKMAIRHE